MADKFFERQCTRFEAKERLKLGDKAFLDKYIPAYEKSCATGKWAWWVFPLLIVCIAFNTVIYTIKYISNEAGFNLLMAIMCGTATLIGTFGTLLFLPMIKFYKIKVEQWKEELRRLNEIQRESDSEQ